MTNLEKFQQRMITDHKQCMYFTILCAESVKHIYINKYPSDDIINKAIATAKLCLNSLVVTGSISAELKKAAANAAADAANAAAADAAYYAYYAAKAAANAAAYYTANAAAYYTANAANRAGIVVDFEALADKAVGGVYEKL